MKKIMNRNMYFHHLLLFVLLAFNFIQAGEKFAFIAKPFKRMEVQRKDNISISCKTNDISAKVYLRNSRKSTDATMDFLRKRMIEVNQTFIISPVQMNDGGRYYCEATNGTNNITFELGILIVNRAPCIEDTKWIDSHKKDVLKVTLEKNKKLVISCLAIGGDSCEDTLYLTKISGASTPGIKFSSCKVDIRDFFTYDLGTFILSNPQPNHEGIYRCTRNVSGCRYNTHADVEMIYITPQAPAFTNITTNGIVKVVEGQDKLLRCDVTASPAPNISWIDRSGRILKRCLNRLLCDYRLPPVRRDIGDVTCVAINSEGSSKAHFKVDVMYPPKVMQIPFRSDNTFKCEVIEGNPRPTILWEKCTAYTNENICNKTSWIKLKADGKHIKIHHIMNGKKQFSTITFLDSNEIGYYRCVGKNAVGEDVSSNFYLDTRQVVSESMLTGLICGFIFLVSLFILILLCYKKYMMHKFALYMEPNKKFKFDKDRSIFEQSIELPYGIEWEFPKKRLKMLKMIGSGAFGEVWVAEARGIEALNPRLKSSEANRKRALIRLNEQVPKHLLGCIIEDEDWEKVTVVAAKTLKGKPSEQEYKDLASEIKVLIHLGSHRNIVNILGACTSGGDLIAIMEFCPHGNLAQFLRARRDIFSFTWRRKSESGYDDDFCLVDVAYAALQIARGMSFLSEKKLVHRDLAARNILVHNNFVLKVADFGLARDIYQTDVYYKKESGILPVKWMAPESIFDKKYTIKSDIWSFGVVLWEICTMGGSPYAGIPMVDLLEHLPRGYRMAKPECCPEELYEVMKICWDAEAARRPSFPWLETTLESIMKNKMKISTNLATFDERLKSLSDETDCLVQASPTRLKSNSFDQLLESKREQTAYNKPRKMSADVLSNHLFIFPPADDVFVEDNITHNDDNNDDNKNENHYIITDYKNVTTL